MTDTTTRRVTISVTQRDIDKGTCVNPRECAVALAAARAFKGRDVTVGATNIQVYEKDGPWLYSAKMPANAQQFIADFDRKYPVIPFKFTVEASS